jgi:hypothetical protein
MPIPIPAESYPLLMDLINQTYLDRVEQITAAQVNDDDSITFVGLDNPKKIAGKITDNDISMKLMTTGQKPQFAAPKKKPKNCSSPTSISCGLTCLPAKTKAGKDTVCKKPLSPNQKTQKKSIVDTAKKSKQPDGIPGHGKEAISQKADQQKAGEKINEEVAKSLKENGVDGQSLTDNEMALLEKNLLSQPKGKIAKLVADGMNKHEASGMADYIGSDYNAINAIFWDQNAKEKLGSRYEAVLAKAKAAESGLSKLPPVTAGAINALVSEGHTSAKPYTGGVLTRGVKLDPATLKTFLKKHQSAVDEGSPVGAGQLLSAAWNDGGHPSFMKNANVEIAITAKMDGSGKGRLVDKYKNTVFENEVLFLPDTKFRVSKVEKIKATTESQGFKDGFKDTEDHKDLKELINLLHPDGAMATKEFYSPKRLAFKLETYASSSLAALSKKHGLGEPPKDPSPSNLAAYRAKIRAAIELEAKKATPAKIPIAIPAQKARVKIHYEEI